MFALLVLSQGITAQTPNILANAFKQFRLGSYREALKILKQVKGDNKTLSTRFYLEGLCHNRLQSYNLAVSSFQKALPLGHLAEDFHYEYGQALYANNALEKARDMFRASYKLPYKAEHSLYYMAYISQLLEQYRMAISAYKRLVSEVGSDKNLLQAAYFQWGESGMAMLGPNISANQKEKDKKINPQVQKIVHRRVLPLFRKAISIDPKSSLAGDINKRIAIVQKHYRLDPNLMRNGRYLPEKRWNVEFSQEVLHDSNITFTAEQAQVPEISKEDSFVFESSLRTSYVGRFRDFLVITPELELRKSIHSEREKPKVYKNDSHSIDLGIENSFEHFLFGRPSSFLLEWDYQNNARDRNEQKDVSKYAQAHTLSFGEKFQFFNFGKTTFKLKYKDYETYHDPDNDNKTYSLSLNQIGYILSGKIWSFFFQTDLIDNYNNDAYSTNSYLVRGDYIHTNLFFQTNLNLALTVALTDTKQQKSTRGTEKRYSPSLTFSRRIGKNFSLSASFEYTKNISKDKENYQYSKNVAGMELSYRF